MKQVFVYLLILVAGAAGGVGAGYLITQSQLDEANTRLEELQADIEVVQSKAESDVQAAEQKTKELETKYANALNLVMLRNKELEQAKTRMTQMQSVMNQALQRQGGGAAQGTQGALTQSTTTTTHTSTPTPGTSAGTSRTAAAALPAGVREYTIEKGDTLWDIAETELGNGIRYKDILELNPDLSENTTLKVGSTIKIPAQ